MQHIALCQDILHELEPRGITDYKIVEKLIELCKTSDSMDTFVESLNHLKLAMTQHFSEKIYMVIRKKLPRGNEQIMEEVGDKVEVEVGVKESEEN